MGDYPWIPWIPWINENRAFPKIYDILVVRSANKAKNKKNIFLPRDQRYSELRTLDRFDDPLAYPGFGLGQNMIFSKYEFKLYFLVEHNF